MATLGYVNGTAKVCDVGRIVSLRFDAATPGSYFEPYMGAAPTLTNGTRTITLVPAGVTSDVAGGRLQWDLYYEIPINENHLTVSDASTWSLEWATPLATDGTNNTTAAGSVAGSTAISVSNTSVMDADWLKATSGTPAAEYYVRANGNDNNNGSNGAAWRNLKKARDYINANHAGQHVVVNVDGGLYNATDNWLVSGNTANSPIHFRATGVNGTPIVDVVGDGGISWGTNSTISNIMFDGFIIRCAGGSSGISLLGSSLGGVWFQRCAIRANGSQRFGNLLSNQYTVPDTAAMTNSLTGVRYHRCVMTDSYGHHGQGDYGYRAPYNRFTACIIDHCGFEIDGNGVEWPITYGHTQYRHGGNHYLQCYMCTFTRSGCNGFSSNSKGAVFIRCMSFQNPCGIHLRGMGHCGAFLCVVEDGQDTYQAMGAGNKVSYGIGCQLNVKWNLDDPANDPNRTDGPAALRLCAFINKSSSVGGSPGIEILNQNAVSRRLMLDGCIVKDWGTGKGLVLTGGNGSDVVHVRNCTIDMRGGSGERTCLEWQTPAIPSNWRFSGTNRYVTGGVARFRLNSVVVSDATYLALDPGAVFTNPSYPDGTRSFSRYCDEVLGLGIVPSNFYAAIRSVAPADFDVRYTQAAYWILPGYTDLVEDPIDPGGSVLTPDWTIIDPNGAAWNLTTQPAVTIATHVAKGESMTVSVRINSTGNADLVLTAISAAGMVIPMPEDGILVEYGDHIDIPVVLSGTVAGNRTATFAATATGLGSKSMTINYVVDEAPVPAKPSGVVAIAGNGQVQLRCNTQADATSYVGGFSTSRGGPYTEGTSPFPAITRAGFTNGVEVFGVVYAVNANGRSVASDEVSATPAPPDNTPTSVTPRLKPWTKFLGKIKAVMPWV